MADTRRKNVQWTLPTPVTDWDQVNSALLMDIRDELQTLNRTMSCSRVIDMANAMIQMNRRLERNYRIVSKRRKAKS